MRRASYVMAAILLTGCTGAEVAVGFTAAGAAAKVILDARAGPQEPAVARTEPHQEERQEPKKSGIPDMLGVLLRLAEPLTGIPAGPLTAGVGGVLALVAWFTTRRKA